MRDNTKYETEDLGKLIKLSREKALKGIYHESFDLYKVCLDLIQQKVKSSPNSSIKEQWFKLGQNIKQELVEVKEILDCCFTFRMEKKEDNSNKNNMVLREYLDFGQGNNPNYNNRKDNPTDNYHYQKQAEDNFKRFNSNDDQERRGDKNRNLYGNDNEGNKANPNQNPDKENLDKKRFERFGGKVPFEYHNDRNFSEDKVDNHQNSRKEPNNNNFNLRKQYSQAGNKAKGSMNVDPEKKRNYEKPWKSNEPEKDKDKKKDKKEEKGKPSSSDKSAFYKHHYPDGEGPDANLIETLEGEVIDKNPCVSFEDIAELDTAKNILKEAVLLPLLMPEFFTGIRRPWKGVLLYGPPGTGKTMLAKALATQGKTVFFNVSAGTFASKWRGESEKLIRLLFEMAKFYAPTTIFIDEVDSIGSKRCDGENEASRRVKSELLVQMDGVNASSSASANASDKENNKMVMVLGATNRPWDLDEALRRRFEKRVYIPLPNEKGRSEMFKINLKGVTLEEGINFDKIVKSTDGYSGADVASVCREASLMQMRRRLLNNSGDIMNIIKNPNFEKEIQAPISESDFLDSLGNISKSVSKKDLEEYDKWTAEFKSS